MSYTDTLFLETCDAILRYGSSDEGMEVRPRWPDGTPAHTKWITNVVHRYDLSSGRIPMLTIRKVNWQAAVDEILWIYQKHSNNVHDLKSHIWDAWADEHGSIGKAYGYQIAQRFPHHIYIPGEDLSDYPSAGVYNDRDWLISIGQEPDEDDDPRTWIWMNQMDAVIWSLRNNPTDRAIITNMYNHQDLAYMALRPCAYSMTYTVSDRNGELHLNGLLNQRSQDMLTANGWNVCQYAILLRMVAQVVGMRAGELVHVIGNCHIYDRHIPIVEELLEKYYNPEWCVRFPDPITNLDPEIKSFKDFTVDAIDIIDYTYAPFDHKIEVAV